MNKIGLTLILFFAFTINSNAQKHELQKDLLGVWQSENKKQQIEVIYLPKKDMYYGKIIYMYEDDQANGREMKDIHNPNPKLRDRRVTGIVLLYNFKYKGHDEFKGLIYDPISGKSYNCNLKILADRKTAEIRGYIFHPLIGRTEIATKLR